MSNQERVSSKAEVEGRYDHFYLNSDYGPRRDFVVSGWPKNRTQAVVAMGGCGESILDIGCGDGMLLYQFRVSFRRLIGLEFSPLRLDRARANLEGLSFEPILGSAENMDSISSGSVDRIICADVIEHIPDVYAATAEMFRVLKPGGILVVNTPNIAFITKRLLLLAGSFPATSQPDEGLGSDILFDGGHLHYFTFRSLGLLLKKAGFRLTKRIGFGPLGRIHNLYPQLLSGGVQWVAMKK